ncbi:MAG: RNA-guided pseudouridylation complex pseudouridine synthase subunit Cbf5 [Euryarchaeota archaeon]|nr:RNA-guided pseudouridylation complex pseudouridine synthase subunit Cbf5 [Euryarchaeota archaeon]
MGSATMILDEKASTDEALGTYPDQKTIEQRLEGGFFLLDKGAGPTSHQVAAWVRDLLGLTRLGHGGTLDPFATGVLPLMAGKSMRLTKQILEHDKTYIAIFQMKNPVDEDRMDEVIQQLTGRIYNVPPEISAVRVQVRTRRIHEFEVLDRNENLLITRIRCEAGTYIRTMAKDMGLLLDQPITLKELRREDSGNFDLKDCVQLHDIADAVWLWKECNEPEALSRMLHPIEKLMTHLPRIIVKDSAVAALAHGAPLLRPGLVSIPGDLSVGQNVLVTSIKGEAVCFVKVNFNSKDISTMEKGEIARPSAVLIGDNVYPRRW